MNGEIELERLRKENKYLKAVLKEHNIILDPPAHTGSLDAQAKILLFASLFKGRPDIYAKQYTTKNGKVGYTPACANEWVKGICQKPAVKCAVCNNRAFLPLTQTVLYSHLTGKQTIGIYPLLENNCCWFLALDLDKKGWKTDALAFLETCAELLVPASLEISRSGNGAHLWVFFETPISAKTARRLGRILTSQTCNRLAQSDLDSFDRFFPNQDSMPPGGFGNLIALPLQRRPRGRGCSVFVDQDFIPYPDQWNYVSQITRLSLMQLETLLAANNSPDKEEKPWEPKRAVSLSTLCELPKSLELIISNQIFINKEILALPLIRKIEELATFHNPEYYRAQAMHRSVWNIPRVIKCAQYHDTYLALPRGVLENLIELLAENKVEVIIKDVRREEVSFNFQFAGTLRMDQVIAEEAIIAYDTGVLCAPTAFGKTVVAASIIAKRNTSTLVLVHRLELLKQWHERLSSFLSLEQKAIGMYGGGKKTLSGTLDIASIQSLVRCDTLEELLEPYSHVVVDECHHIPATSFERVLSTTKARYVLGLTATPMRRDGHHPIIFMQCGPMRYNLKHLGHIGYNLKVTVRPLPTSVTEGKIQALFKGLVHDQGRNKAIIADIISAYKSHKKILVLTERTEHVKILYELLQAEVVHCFALHGRMSKIVRNTVFTAFNALPEHEPRVLIATGKLIGEGFDCSYLDTLFLAMPISWRGTLQQYTGRLHRNHAGKREARVYDYIDTESPQLTKMWKKRELGYKAMGYVIDKD